MMIMVFDKFRTRFLLHKPLPKTSRLSCLDSMPIVNVKVGDEIVVLTNHLVKVVEISEDFNNAHMLVQYSNNSLRKLTYYFYDEVFVNRVP